MYKIKLLVRTLILIIAVTLAAVFVSYRAGVFRLDLIAQETTSFEKEGAAATAVPPSLIPMISLTPRTSSIPADKFLDTSKSGRVFTRRPPEVPTMAGASETIAAIYKDRVFLRSSKSMPVLVGRPFEVATVAATPRASVPK